MMPPTMSPDRYSRPPSVEEDARRQTNVVRIESHRVLQLCRHLRSESRKWREESVRAQRLYYPAPHNSAAAR